MDPPVFRYICSAKRYGEQRNFCRADNSTPKIETGRFPVANAIMTRCAEQCRLNNKPVGEL